MEIQRTDLPVPCSGCRQWTLRILLLWDREDSNHFVREERLSSLLTKHVLTSCRQVFCRTRIWMCCLWTFLLHACRPILASRLSDIKNSFISSTLFFFFFCLTKYWPSESLQGKRDYKIQNERYSVSFTLSLCLCLSSIINVCLGTLCLASNSPHPWHPSCSLISVTVALVTPDDHVQQRAFRPRSLWFSSFQCCQMPSWWT